MNEYENKDKVHPPHDPEKHRDQCCSPDDYDRLVQGLRGLFRRGQCELSGTGPI